MSWSVPKTWTPGEMVTASMMNTHVKANEDVLATYRITSATAAAGYHAPALATFGYSSGTYNSGTGDTALTAYDVVIPAGLMSVQGDWLRGDFTWQNTATAGTTTFKVSIDGGTTKTTLVTLTNTSVYGFCYFRIIRRGSAASGSVWTRTVWTTPSSYFAANASLGTFSFDTGFTVKLYSSHSGGSNNALMLDYALIPMLGLSGGEA